APLSWSADGKTLAFVRQATPHFGDHDKSQVMVTGLTGPARELTGLKRAEGYPQFAPTGKRVVYSSPRDGDFNNVKEWHVTELGSKAGRCVTAGLDRNAVWCTWMPDGKSLLVGGH